VYAAPSAMKAIGGVVIGVGTVLVLIAAVWGRSGYYLSEAPILLLLALGGLACVGIGLALYRSTPSNSTVEPEASESVATRAFAALQKAPAAVVLPLGHEFVPEMLDEKTRERPDRTSQWVLVLPDASTLAITDALVIGRQPVSQDGGAIAELPSDQVSRSHARFSMRGELLTVRDLGSTNGTVIVHPDGSEESADSMADSLLGVTDRLELGSYVMRVERR
jgi:hypothetical protein